MSVDQSQLWSYWMAQCHESALHVPDPASKFARLRDLCDRSPNSSESTMQRVVLLLGGALKSGRVTLPMFKSIHRELPELTKLLCASEVCTADALEVLARQGRLHVAVYLRCL